MEERTIIQSENIFANPKMKRLLVILAVILIALIVLSLLSSFVISETISNNARDFWRLHTNNGGRQFDSAENQQKYWSMNDAADNLYILGFVGLGLSGLLLIFIIAFLILYLSGKVQQITVTDKRVYGIAAHKSRVDLPLDSVSAVATSAFKGLSVATSSGRITFIGIKNRDEIHKVISDLLIERQSKPKAVVQEEKPAAPSNVAEQLKQLKELVDAGILTQEEFDAKKKQLLGL